MYRCSSRVSEETLLENFLRREVKASASLSFLGRISAFSVPPAWCWVCIFTRFSLRPYRRPSTPNTWFAFFHCLGDGSFQKRPPPNIHRPSTIFLFLGKIRKLELGNSGSMSSTPPHPPKTHPLPTTHPAGALRVAEDLISQALDGGFHECCASFPEKKAPPEPHGFLLVSINMEVCLCLGPPQINK